MKLEKENFEKQLRKFIPLRGIDIILYLKDGSILELDKNRQLEGNYIQKKNRNITENTVAIQDIVRAEFFAA